MWLYCLHSVLERGIIDSKGRDTAERMWTLLFLPPPPCFSLLEAWGQCSLAKGKFELKITK